MFNHSCSYLSQFFYHLQHGFLKGRSTVTQLLEVYHELLASLASGKEVDAIYLDLSKAFNKVPHHLLTTKLERYGISGSLLKWFTSYLANRNQRVTLEGALSNWLPVTSGVPQGSILGPLLFLVYTNNLPDYVRDGSKLALFADYSKLCRSLDCVGLTTLLQQDLDGLHRWSVDWHMEYNVKKMQRSPHFQEKNLKHQADLSPRWTTP